MRYLLLITLFLSACATTPRHDYRAPSTTALHQNITNAGTEIDKARDLSKQAKDQIAIARKLAPKVAGLQLALDTANARIDSLTQSLLDAKTQTDAALKETAKVKKDGEALATSANSEATRADRAEKSRAIIAKRYHSLKFIVCLALAALAAMIVWRLKWIFMLIPPPYNFVAMGALPVLVFTFCFWRL